MGHVDVTVLHKCGPGGYTGDYKMFSAMGTADTTLKGTLLRIQSCRRFSLFKPEVGQKIA